MSFNYVTPPKTQSKMGTLCGKEQDKDQQESCVRERREVKTTQVIPEPTQIKRWTKIHTENQIPN